MYPLKCMKNVYSYVKAKKVVRQNESFGNFISMIENRQFGFKTLYYVQVLHTYRELEWNIDETLSFSIAFRYESLEKLN